MNEVFISYSRRDSEFIKQLIEALKKAGIDPWQDLEDLSPAGRWQEELLIAIQACHDFIYAISPDSCVSDFCSKELTHALLHDKRIIPILIKYTSQSNVPVALQELNWIDFTADFSTGLKSLLQALDNPLGISIGNRLDSKLEILTGFRKSFYLYRNQYLIGRHPSGNICDYGMIFLGDRTISRTHFTLKRQQNRWHILDGIRQGRNYQVSLNGVLLNGKPIEPGTLKPLASNDCIQIGNSTLLYTELSFEEKDPTKIDDRDTLINKGDE